MKNLEEEEFGTTQERQQAIEELKEWARSHDEPDLPHICLPQIGKMLTPHEIATDMEEETGLGIALLDIVISESRRMGVTSVDYVKHLGKKIQGGNILPDFDKEVN